MDEQEFVRPAGLKARLCGIMGEVGYIPKRGKNTAQNYDYVMAADIAGAMAKLMNKWGLVMYPTAEHLEWETRETSKGTAMFVCRASMAYLLANVDSDEQVLIPSTGEGMDTGDKAIYKARTAALKYALIQTFLIAAGDDPEDEEEDKELKSQGGVKVATKPAHPACPLCGNAQSIIKSKPEYGGGWLCYDKKGGCGAKFRDDDDRLAASVPRRPDNRDTMGGVGSVATATDTVVRPEDTILQTPNREVITADQLAQLEEWAAEFGTNIEAMVKQYAMSDKAIRSLADLTPANYLHAEKVFEAKRAKARRLNGG